MKPNYGFAKRQRELAKKQKKEEKKLRKQADDAPPVVDTELPPAASAHSVETPQQ